MRNICCALVLLVISPWGLTQVDAESTLAGREALEHQRIRQDRAEAMGRFAARDVGCYQKFAVNDCLADVRSERRMLLADLRRQEISLNDGQRKRRAADQLLRADEKAGGRP